MRVIKKGTLESFGAAHAPALEPLRAWHDLVKRTEWTKPSEIKKQFASASFVAGNRVVFNIKGNAYRLIVKVVYKKPSMKQGIVFIIAAMTHAEYDKIDVTTIRYEG